MDGLIPRERQEDRIRRFYPDVDRRYHNALPLFLWGRCFTTGVTLAWRTSSTKPRLRF